MSDISLFNDPLSIAFLYLPFGSPGILLGAIAGAAAGFALGIAAVWIWLN